MKKIQSAFFILLLFAITLSVSAQEDSKEKTEEAKTGWNVGALPVISFDSDFGFQYGALSSIYNYGDGSRYPEFDHQLYFEASKFTKGSGIFRFAYEGDRLINGVRINFDLAYLPDEASPFYGYNGYESVYNAGWEDQEDADYRSRMIYKHKRNLFRITADFVGAEIGKIEWTAGFGYYNFDIGSVDIEKLNKGKEGSDILPTVDDVPGLYENYVYWGLIPAAEKAGGSIVNFKVGATYDSRDNRPNPNRGIWSEAGFSYAPGFLGSNEKGFVKFYVTHRQYFTIVKNRLTFAYRLGYQNTIAGETPWYAQNIVIIAANRSAFSEGLGGSKTIRGVLRNRVVGDGFAYGNFEMRWKAVKFQFINQNFYIGINGFLDAGKVVNLIPITVPNEITTDDYFDIGAEALHLGYGAGLKIVMNQNFIISLDYGLAAAAEDGTSGMYIGLNYLF